MHLASSDERDAAGYRHFHTTKRTRRARRRGHSRRGIPRRRRKKSGWRFLPLQHTPTLPPWGGGRSFLPNRTSECKTLRHQTSSLRRGDNRDSPWTVLVFFPSPPRTALE